MCQKMPAEPSNDYRVVVFGAGGEIFVFDVATGQGPASKVLTQLETRCRKDQPGAEVHPRHLPGVLRANDRGYVQEGDQRSKTIITINFMTYLCYTQTAAVRIIIIYRSLSSLVSVKHGALQQ